MTQRGDGVRRWVFLAAGAAAAVALAVCVMGLVFSKDSGPVDMQGHRVRADDVASTAASASPVQSTGSRFVVRSVGLDVPLGAIDAVGGNIEPPGFTSAYRVRNEGVSLRNSAHGTVFVVMHSLRNGGIGPGNYLIDVDRHRAKVRTGATITVAGVSYRVTGSEAISKQSIAENSAVWANTPNRLVVITCLQRPQGGPSKQNMVIEATRS